MILTKKKIEPVDERGTNDTNNKKVAVQIDPKLLEKYDEKIEDLIDGIIAESRKDEPKKSLDTVIKNLRKKGKLK